MVILIGLETMMKLHDAEQLLIAWADWHTDELERLSDTSVKFFSVGASHFGQDSTLARIDEIISRMKVKGSLPAASVLVSAYINGEDVSGIDWAINQFIAEYEKP